MFVRTLYVSDSSLTFDAVIKFKILKRIQVATGVTGFCNFKNGPCKNLIGLLNTATASNTLSNNRQV